MASKLKNIIIITIVAVVLILAYIYFLKKDPTESLTVSDGAVGTVTENQTTQNSNLAKDFLTLLLSVKSIKLDGAIFSDKAFVNLHDSSIDIQSTGDEGRDNPFAPIGFDKQNIAPVTNSTNSTESVSNTPSDSVTQN